MCWHYEDTDIKVRQCDRDIKKDRKERKKCGVTNRDRKRNMNAKVNEEEEEMMNKRHERKSFSCLRSLFVTQKTLETQLKIPFPSSSVITPRVTRVPFVVFILSCLIKQDVCFQVCEKQDS